MCQVCLILFFQCAVGGGKKHLHKNTFEDGFSYFIQLKPHVYFSCSKK